jgi:asparagine synthase (glutamine-hydrolysing)
MPAKLPVASVVDLCDPSANVLYDLDVEQARRIVGGGNADEIAAIRGHFALAARDPGPGGTTVRMARTIGRLMRYFVAKVDGGPILVVSDRIDAIAGWLREHGLADQFHPSYTRMVPAHHLVEVRLVGCPDPNPTYRRFFRPEPGTLPADLDVIGQRYARAVYDEIATWLKSIPRAAPVGVCFSGGVDSGAVFLLAYRALLELGMSPARLKAFTLAVDGRGQDLHQARSFLGELDLELFLEAIEVAEDCIDLRGAVGVIEDYKPLDVQAAAVNLALLRGIRARYPEWRYLLDGDGGDENLKDYPISENPELTIRSVLNNRMLYQEGWGVDSIKHSLTYSGGQSRGYARSYAPAAACGFRTLSPYVAPAVIAVAEAIPFIELTGWQEERLYRLKGEIVSRGVRAVTGFTLPVFEKCRFQRGAVEADRFTRIFPEDAREYRRMFQALYA